MVTTKEAVTQLVKALKEDEDYRDSWVANIAMAIKDQHTEVEQQFYDSHMTTSLHEMANNSANWFLKLLCADIESTDDSAPIKKIRVLRVYPTQFEARKAFFDAKRTIVTRDTMFNTNELTISDSFSTVRYSSMHHRDKFRGSFFDAVFVDETVDNDFKNQLSIACKEFTEVENK